MAHTTRGVMASDAVTSSRLMMFWITSFSLSSSSPDSSATSAMALTSSREMAVSCSAGVIHFWMPSTAATMGYRQNTRPRMVSAANPISDFQ